MPPDAVMTAKNETRCQRENPETSDLTVADTRDKVDRVLDEPRVTFDQLLNDIELCMQKSWEGKLDVRQLEQLTADFATFLTFPKSNGQNPSAEKLDVFYTQLKLVVSECASNEKVSGKQERKNALKDFSENLINKFEYFKKNLHSSNEVCHADTDIYEFSVGG